jgi:hypothetical protein
MPSKGQSHETWRKFKIAEKFASALIFRARSIQLYKLIILLGLPPHKGGGGETGHSCCYPHHRYGGGQVAGSRGGSRLGPLLQEERSLHNGG